MPGKKVIVQWEGQERNAVPVEVTGSSEPWSVYMLEDGTTLKLKNTLTGVYRIEGAYDPDGNPAYATRSQLIAIVSDSRDDMKRKTS